MDDKAKATAMCDDCGHQQAKGRRGTLHENLISTGQGRECRSIMGAADEAYYRCKICGHEWLHETGSCGMGCVP